MDWNSGSLVFFGASALLSAGGILILHRFWQARFQALRKELARVSEDLVQAVELQGDIYRRVSRELNDIEEKVMDLSVPSSDTPPPLERRHQVLTLARKGVGIDEIARRLNMPKGEAELILSLRKYSDVKIPGDPLPSALKSYARA